MPEFISAPTLQLTAEQIAGLTGGAPTAGGGKEIYIDSSATRAQYFESMASGGPVVETLPGSASIEGTRELAPAVTIEATNEGLPPNVLKALQEGKPLTPDMMAEMPPPFLSRSSVTLKPNGFPAPTQPASQPYSPVIAGSGAALPARGETPGLVVRVGRGITATVTFSGEPEKKHWERLQRFIKVAAEEIEDEPENLEESLVRRGIIPSLSSLVSREQTDAGGRGDLHRQPESSQPRVSPPARRRKRQNVSSAAEPANAGAHHVSD